MVELQQGRICSPGIIQVLPSLRSHRTRKLGADTAIPPARCSCTEVLRDLDFHFLSTRYGSTEQGTTEEAFLTYS